MPRLQKCPCGSGQVPEALHDGYNIFLCYACDKCKARKLKGYRSDIMTRYDCDEPIDAD